MHVCTEASCLFLTHRTNCSPGRLLHLGGILTNEIPSFRRGGATKSNQLNLPARGEDSERSVTLSVDFGLVHTLPADRDILSASWLTPELLVLGLSQGDSMIVQLQTEGSESTFLVGKRLKLREQLLKDRGSGLQALWSDFMGRVADANSDTIDIAATSSSVLSVNRSGEFRLWSAQSRQLVAHSYLYDLLAAVGAAEDFLPRRSGPVADHEVDKNIHLQGNVHSLFPM